MLDFDLNRAFIREKPAVAPLRNPVLMPIREAAAQYGLEQSTLLLKTTVGNQTLVFSTLHLLYFHVAQGTLADTPWMVSFCLICNAGACFSPILDGKIHHFMEHGLYNAMTLLADEETRSIWNHLNGECYHGAWQGSKLTVLDVLQHTTLEQALAMVPEAQFVVSELKPDEHKLATEWDHFRQTPHPDLGAGTLRTMGKEDLRLPRFEAGLGVWSYNEACFYPYVTLNAHDNILFDKLDGQQMVVYIDPTTQNPQAYYTEARSARWENDTLILNTKETMQDGLWFAPNGQQVALKFPMQLFQRWYSFAFLFPHGRIGGR